MSIIKKLFAMFQQELLKASFNMNYQHKWSYQLIMRGKELAVFFKVQYKHGEIRYDITWKINPNANRACAGTIMLRLKACKAKGSFQAKENAQ